MEIPSYVLLKDNTAAIDIRALYDAIGFKDRGFADWFTDRATAHGLSAGKDYILQKKDAMGRLTYVVTVPAAVKLLDTFKIKAERKAAIAPYISQIQALLFEFKDRQVAVEGIDINAFGTLELFASVIPAALPPKEQPESPAGSVLLDGPVPVFQIDGRAAVDARYLFALWTANTTSRLSQWANYRIDALSLIIGRHYVEYRGPAVPGHKRGTSEYIFSLEAALSMADFEPKGRGKEVVDYLSAIKKRLRASGLPTKGKLADFIGMKLPEPQAEPELEVPALEPSFAGQAVVPPLNNGVPSLENVLPESNEANTAPLSGDPREEAQSALTGVCTPLPLENGAVPQPFEGAATEDDPGSEEQAEIGAAPGPFVNPQRWQDLTARVQFLELTVGKLVSILQSQSRAMMGLNRSAEPMPEMPLRSRINEIVNQQVRLSGVDQEELFTWAYQQLLYRYGIKIKAYARRESESYLQVAEREGVLDKVYAIVTSAEFKAYNGASEAMAA